MIKESLSRANRLNAKKIKLDEQIIKWMMFEYESGCITTTTTCSCIHDSN
jgi:hypothetical protein